MPRKQYPRIESVQPLAGRRLLVRFVGGAERIYDCEPLFSRQEFAPLQDEALFATVKVDPGGYGVSWSEEIDLSESDLWLHGKPVKALGGPGARLRDSAQAPPRGSPTDSASKVAESREVYEAKRKPATEARRSGRGRK